jgi:cytochrome c biogenesis protein CcdA
VIEFTFAVFVVYLLGGVLVALGPGHLVVAVLPHPRREVTHILEIAAGLAVVVIAGFLWVRRRPLSLRRAPMSKTAGRGSAVLGATITAIELPTAFPYFAAIAVIAGSGVDRTGQIVLLVLFNLCFVLPMIAIFALLVLTGDRSTMTLARIRDRLRAHWPAWLAGLALLAGSVVALIGLSGVVSAS